MAQPAGSRIIAVLEQAWFEIRARHRDVPPVVVITGTGRQARGFATLGHFGADRWQSALAEGGRLPELFIAGELLAGRGQHSGGRAVLKTLLHEAAHGLAHTRRVKDCSRQNRYHNRRFAALAAELGLTVPGEPHPTLGWSMVTLEDQAAAGWLDVISAIDAARLPHLGVLSTAAAPLAASRAGTRFQVACGCESPRTLSITPRQFETAALICGACRGPFEPS
ncbi:MAG TPA: hypothetical protein VGS97_10475 [Actinocrinis sp.]|uniref:hypothetical protein n=1 Tax=Actinocrinis sp. TaxID=1920516 RepID=UPI002DDCDE92|nr:hypothetical protein [Actinocrinis sp.]HEV2344506.1 hypothetical protein [Actinocrinis sp.]